MVVGVLLVAEVLPGQAAIIRAVDTARADTVVKLASSKDDILVVRGHLDHIIVEALPAAVVFDVLGAGAARQHRPAGATVGGLEDARGMIPIGICPVETGVQRAATAGRRMREVDREAGCSGGKIR